MSTYVLGNGYLGSLFEGERIVTDVDGDVVSKLSRKFLGKGDVVINCVGIKGDCGSVALSSHFANVWLPIEVAGVCERAGCKMIHFSTALAGEYDLYARQKAYVDYLLPLINNNFTIYKLSWLFGKEGDFVSKAIGCIERGESVPVYDEIGSPTYVKDVVEYVINHVNNHKNEIVELANKGCRVRSGLVQEIAELMGKEWDYHLIHREHAHKVDCSLKGQLRPYNEALKEYLNDTCNNRS